MTKPIVSSIKVQLLDTDDKVTSEFLLKFMNRDSATKCYRRFRETSKGVHRKSISHPMSLPGFEPCPNCGYEKRIGGRCLTCNDEINIGSKVDYLL